MKTYYIGADVDSKMTNFAVEAAGRIVGEYCVPTTISGWRSVLSTLEGTRIVAMEEGTLAGWLYRSLKDQVEEFIVCDPRKNGLIYQDGDKVDPVDARKLASLLRGGYLRPVHHSDDEDRVALKEWVSLYHDRVREAVRQGHKLRDRCRLHGIRLTRTILAHPDRRRAFLAEQGSSLREQLEVGMIGYEAVREQVSRSKSQVARRSGRYPVIERWSALPGVGLIRAATFFAYMDTPFRFKSAKQVWKYCGVGLQRTSSGKNKKGEPNAGTLQLAWAVNRHLKSVAMGMALSAIQQRKNIFYDYYERQVVEGVDRANARHSVARKMVSVMWGMWKNNGRYQEALVFDASEPSGKRRGK
jgi:transposase